MVLYGRRSIRVGKSQMRVTFSGKILWRLVSANGLTTRR